MVVKIGTFGNDLLVGSTGADFLSGSFGNDLLRGLSGVDSLSGGGDDDTLDGGAGDDNIDGGGGIDTLLFDTNADVEVLFQTGEASSASTGNDSFAFVENVTTGDGDDNIEFSIGLDQDNIARTYGGHDRVLGGAGDDTVYLGAGNDEATGGSGDDTLYGGNNNDDLWGGAGDDTLEGGSGADDLDGGGDIDLLTGDGGADDFNFALGDSGVGAGDRDIVADFKKSQNDDLDLSDFGGLDFIGTSTFDAPDQVRFTHSGGNTIVSINTSGNSGAEMEIQLTGVINLAAGDFIF